MSDERGAPSYPAYDGRMVAADPTTALDAEAAEWLRLLGTSGAARDQAIGQLHDLLVRIARAELRRRNADVRVTGPEIDDLAFQAAADALVAVLAKIDKFRGESKFTTWAYSFVMFEVSSKLGRHFWRHHNAQVTGSLDADGWDRLPDRFGLDPAREAEWRDLAAELRRAVRDDLTSRQREVFVAIVVDGIPLEALAVKLDTNRNALYKTLFDARRKLRVTLAAHGYLTPDVRGSHE